MLQLFILSSKELKKLHTITGAALLLALYVILNFFSIQVTPSLRFGFGYLSTALMGLLYGPVTAMIASGLGDLLQFAVKPTGTFFFGFTLNAMLSGMLYGCFLYPKKVTLLRVSLAKLFHNLLINILLNTYWLSILMGKGFYALLIPRIAKNLVLLPVEILLLYVLLRQIVYILNRSARTGM